MTATTDDSTQAHLLQLVHYAAHNADVRWWDVADGERSRVARAASERALVRVVHHYGARPEFVVLGGLVPELLLRGTFHRRRFDPA